MSKEEAKLGTTPTGTEGRDAVHVAIVPAKAYEILPLGCQVFLNSEGEAEKTRGDDAIGVVDPFLQGGHVPAGAWFWLCLYPKTITGLRHVWEHPCFPSLAVQSGVMPAGDKLASEAWITAYVRWHCPYWENESDGGYACFMRYVTRERWIFYNGSDCHSLADVEDADELFRHLSVVLDRRIDASYFEEFTCSC